MEANPNALTTIHIDNNTSDTGAGADLKLESDAGSGNVTSYSSAFTTSNEFIADSLFVGAASTASGGLVLAASGANPINVFTNGTKRVTVESGGDIGIGNDNPASNLELSACINKRLCGNLYVECD